MRIRVQFSFVFLLLAMTGQPRFGASNRTADIVIAGGEKKTPDVPAAAIAEIRPRAPSYRFPERQTLVYSAEWRLFNAGTVTLRTEPSGAEQQVIATADTYGIVNLLFSVHDKFRTSLDPKSFCSLAVNKHTEEGKRKREINLRFDYQRRKSVFDEKNLNNGGQRHVENAIPHCVTDVMSGFYYLASLPLENGARYTLPVSDGGPTNDISAVVEKREQLTTPAGKFQTIRVAAQAASGPLKNKGSIWLWYSDDGQRIPVQMRARVKWGTMTFRLQE